MAYNAEKQFLHRCISGKKLYHYRRFGWKTFFPRPNHPYPPPPPLQKSKGRPLTATCCSNDVIVQFNLSLHYIVYSFWKFYLFYHFTFGWLHKWLYIVFFLLPCRSFISSLANWKKLQFLLTHTQSASSSWAGKSTVSHVILVPTCTEMHFICSVCSPCGRLKTRLKVMRMRAGGRQKRRPGHYCLTHLVHIRIMLTVEKTTGRNDWKIILARQISRGWRNWKRSMIRLAHSPETISDFDIEFITLF